MPEVRRLACLEVRGGNDEAAYAAELPGLAGWFGAVRCVRLRLAGDLYDRSACGARFANGDRAFPALMSAHRLRAASAMALRPGALSFRFDFAVALSLANRGLLRVPDGRPRRFPVVPPRASMARFSLSRSANNNARICSDIRSIATQANTHKMTSKVATPVNIQGQEPGQVASSSFKVERLFALLKM